MNPLIQLAIEETPAVIAALRDLFQKSNPTSPAPSDADVMAAFESAFASSRAKDEAWLAAHPAP